MNLHEFIHAHSIFSAQDVATSLGISQASVSRALKSSGLDLARLGKGPSSLYGLYEAILGLPAEQGLIWVDEHGRSSALATLHHLRGGNMYLEPAARDGQAKTKPVLFRASPGELLPWWLSTLRLEGYLGRQRVSEMAPSQPLLSPDIAQWSGTQHLYAHLVGRVDGRGAILLGEPSASLWAQACAAQGLAQAELESSYEALATQQLRSVLPGATSADGEQAKFIARRQDLDGAGNPSPVECIVKFSPPRGTPFGERWHELLHIEQIASEVLAQAGFAVARSRIIRTAKRTFLEGERLDRVARAGRRHMLSFAVVQQAFLIKGLMNWSDIARALIRQRRLSGDSQRIVDTLRAFGHLIGNTDMHNGNQSVFIDSPNALWNGKLRLAPSYDMLSMRWAPQLGQAPDYAWFDAAPLIAGIPSEAREDALSMARSFWERIVEIPDVSTGLLVTATKALNDLHGLA